MGKGKLLDVIAWAVFLGVLFGIILVLLVGCHK